MFSDLYVKVKEKILKKRSNTLINTLDTKYNVQHFIYNNEFILVESFDLHNFEIAIAPRKNLASLSLIGCVKAITNEELINQVKNLLENRK